MSTFAFPYTGSIQNWTATISGYYRLEVWGAEGGTHTGIGQKNVNQAFNNGIGRGGYGGYSTGVLKLKQGDSLYVYVGGRGQNERERTLGQTYGGWNGGGSNKGYFSNNYNPTGGGATDISTIYSPVVVDSSYRYSRSFLSYQSRVIVAGGGGAGCILSSNLDRRSGGHGGGITGNNGLTGLGSLIGYGGSQTAGGSTNSGGSSGMLGLGSGFGHTLDGASGGGGYYGGGESRDSGAGGGSGYIGKVMSYRTIKRKMCCYQCQTSNSDSTYTESTNSYSISAISYKAKSGDGYALITTLRIISYDFKAKRDHVIVFCSIISISCQC